MARKVDLGTRLRRSILALHMLSVQVTIILIFAFFLIWMLSGIANITFAIGGVIGLIGIVVLFASMFLGEDIGLAAGIVLEFTGAGIGCIGTLTLGNIVTIMTLMVFGPLALAQYEIGICVMTVQEYAETEGTDHMPAVEDLEEHMEDKLRTVFALSFLAYMTSVFVLMVNAIYAELFAINSIAMSGILIGVIIAGAALLFLLKGGRLPKEDEEEGKEKVPLPS